MIRSRSAAIRLLILAFALGGLVGGAATMVAERSTHSDPRGRDGSRIGFIQRLDEELGLTDSQEQQIAALLARHEPAMDSTWAAVRVQFAPQRQQVRSDIRAVLTPEQVAKYDAMLARRDSTRRSRESKHGDK